MKTVQLGSTEVPAGKLLCIGRNYAEHAREMKAEVPKEPVVFLKPASAIIASGETIVIPPFSNDVHHEVELVVLIGKQGKNIARVSAFEYVAGYAVGLDMTLRDIQAEAKKKGLPWTVAKGFDTSAPVSPFVPAASIPDPQQLAISLSVNGTERQHGSTADMLFPVDVLVAYLSTVFTLEPGDMIFTGTPDGVGPVVTGDMLEASIESVGSLLVGVR
jgi:2-keto-4-pentenoate hydratase/2-oxohepta-3-ene-1,7-dioic acid hydratase in catechol pathway